MRTKERRKSKNRIDIDVYDEEIIGETPQGKIILRKRKRSPISAELEGIDEEFKE